MDNDFRAPNFKKGQLLKATELTRITDGVRATPLRKTIGGLTRRGSTGQSFRPHRSRGSSSQSIVIIPRSVDGNDYTADIVDGFTNQTVLTSGHLARIGSGETSNNQAPIDNPYVVTRIEQDGE
ncbi:MAG: hypothetical protein NE327_09175, partial [Lentisphaeraceae bacterium]|nr:hypothetical protein [Lentisphaeraceae bacterium]